MLPEQKAAAQKITCNICGMAFATEQEKEKHTQLEHMENKKPTGVG